MLMVKTDSSDHFRSFGTFGEFLRRAVRENIGTRTCPLIQFQYESVPTSGKQGKSSRVSVEFPILVPLKIHRTISRESKSSCGVEVRRGVPTHMLPSSLDQG
ncbi:hypothetical protein TNCV_1789641 [Trichonephila clavipes]|nr:hypothetical protein TNCV_1789641 [Trichonephila clavipes]